MRSCQRFSSPPKLARGGLRALDVGEEPEGAILRIAYPKSRHPSAKVREMTACLRLTFGEPAYWDREAALPQRGWAAVPTAGGKAARYCFSLYPRARSVYVTSVARSASAVRRAPPSSGGKTLEPSIP